MIGAADVRYCERCKRGTPHTRRGDCKTCLALRRRAARQLKKSVLGMPLESYSALLEVADRVWSAWVRAFWPACEMCQAPAPPSSLQCAHGFSRQERALRFDPDNCFGLCSACHRRHTPPRADWWEWMRERLKARGMEGHRGGLAAYDRLELLSKARGAKLTALSLQAVIVDAQARIAALPAGERKDWAIENAQRHLSKLTRVA